MCHLITDTGKMRDREPMGLPTTPWHRTHAPRWVRGADPAAMDSPSPHGTAVRTGEGPTPDCHPAPGCHPAPAVTLSRGSAKQVRYCSLHWVQAAQLFMGSQEQGSPPAPDSQLVPKRKKEH